MIYLASLCRTAVHLAHTNLLLLGCGRESECSCWLSKSICTVVHLQTTDSTCMCAVSPPSLFPSLPPSLSPALSFSLLNLRTLQPDTNSHSLCIQRIRASFICLYLFPAPAAHPRIPNRSGAEVRARTCQGIAGSEKGQPSQSEEGLKKRKNP